MWTHTSKSYFQPLVMFV